MVTLRNFVKGNYRAIKTRATKRSIAFLGAKYFLSTQIGLLVDGCERGRRMSELWHNRHETLVSIEALATSSLLPWWPLALFRSRKVGGDKPREITPYV
jgi:hypothetical protein